MSPENDKDTQALATIGNLALAPVDGAARDSDADLALNPEFEQNELRLPQLKVCQDGTPQRKRNDPNYIKDLAEGDLFNDASSRIYGTGPLKFVMLKYWTNFIKFRPLDQGGGIICRGFRGADGVVRDEDGNVLNTEFGANGEKPEVTKFMNYLFYLPDTQEIVWFSAKSTFLKPMRAFHTALRGVAGIADYRKVFTLSTTQTKGGGKDYYIPVLPKRPIGLIPAESELAAHLKRLTSDLATKTVDTSAAETTEDDNDGEDVPF
jgi:hypothetical protein